MLSPTITDYIHALDSDHATLRTIRAPLLQRDEYGVPEIIAGNSAVIFPYTDRDGRRRFFKCHIRPNPHLRTIYEYVWHHRPTILPEARLLPGELFVHTTDGRSGWIDVVEGAWIEGETLARAISGAAKARDRQRLGALADAFDRLLCTLRECEWAHGDIKPENIVVGTSGELTLIDCDAMWIPALEGHRAVELGTPPWRHPAREANVFDKSIDDYPAHLISITLRLLSLNPALWPGYSRFEELVSTSAQVDKLAPQMAKTAIYNIP